MCWLDCTFSFGSIFNHCIVSGVFPDDWKCSKVILLFKQGKSDDLNNYHPISIIPVVAKAVMERTVYNQVFTHLIVNNLLFSHQLGFRQLHSTVTALLEAINNWALNIDKGGVNAVIVRVPVHFFSLPLIFTLHLIGGRLHFSFCHRHYKMFTLFFQQKNVSFFLPLVLDLCRPFSLWASLACRLLSLFLCLSLALYSKFVDMTIILSLIL